MARDDKELSALLRRINELERAVTRVREQRQILEEEEKAALAELSHIRTTVAGGFSE